MIKLKKVKIPIYYGTLVIILTENLEKIGKYTKNDIKDGDYGAFAFEEVSKDEYVIVIKEKNRGTISHEAVHVVNYLFKSRGVQLDLDNDEPTAYMNGWVVSQIEKFFKEYEKPKINNI